MQKKKIAFMAPETKGGPYYIYKDIVGGLKEKYGDSLDIYFFNSKKDWIKLHFAKYDFIFSVIPFLFKPFGTKNYIYNLHGNYEIEKKRKGLGNKLLYFAKMNLKFVDNIMLNSYFLADKIGFREKYNNKIIIFSNPISIDITDSKKTLLKSGKDINILTVSSTKFLEKGMGIVDIGNKISEIRDINITWTIIAGGDKINRDKIQIEFNKIKFHSNIKIKWLGWIEKEKLEQYYKRADIFLYATRLDTWGMTIMEAMSYGLPIILYNYELWKYIYPKEIITENITRNIDRILNNYEYYSDLSIKFVKNYRLENIVDQIFKFITRK